MNALLAGLTPDELLWLATKISRAESYAAGKYVDSDNRTQRELFEELLKVRLDAEAADQKVTREHPERKRNRTPRACLHSWPCACACGSARHLPSRDGGR